MPSLYITVSTTVYVPGFSYMWDVVYPRDTGVLSPKFHIYSSTCPVVPFASKSIGFATIHGDILGEKSIVLT